MSNVTKVVNTQEKFWKFHVKDVILWNLTFIFLGSRKKYSSVLLQTTNYIYSPCKMLKKNAIPFKLFLYKNLVHWKLKLSVETVLTLLSMPKEPQLLKCEAIAVFLIAW